VWGQTGSAVGHVVVHPKNSAAFGFEVPNDVAPARFCDAMHLWYLRPQNQKPIEADLLQVLAHLFRCDATRTSWQR